MRHQLRVIVAAAALLSLVMASRALAPARRTATVEIANLAEAVAV